MVEVVVGRCPRCGNVQNLTEEVSRLIKNGTTSWECTYCGDGFDYPGDGYYWDVRVEGTPEVEDS